MKKNIAVFCGGPSSEHEVSLLSCRAILSNLDKEKYNVVVVYITKDLKAKIIRRNFDFKRTWSRTSLASVLKIIEKENRIALLAGIHGEFVEDGKLQNLLETFNIRYTGSNEESSELAMDKTKTFKVAKKIKGLKMPEGQIFPTTTQTKNLDLTFPLVIKPNTLGSSVGVFIALSNKDLQEALLVLRKKLFFDKVVIQEFITDGIELSCGCLQKKNGEFIALPPIEIHPKKAEFFDYKSKYLKGASVETCPPISIPKKVSDKISAITMELHTLLGLRTYSRSDFIVKNNDIYFLETNTLPGMTTTSLLPQEAQAYGMSYSELLDFIIENSI